MAKQQTPLGSFEARADESALAPEQFRPASLSALVAWLFGPRNDAAQSEPEPFDEHINGLA
jgi:hypothetical protein